MRPKDLTKPSTGPMDAKKYLAMIGSKGGKKSRRKLTPEQARAMVASRERRRALAISPKTP